MAAAMLGFGEKAVEYYRMMTPIEHSRTREAADKYKVEPYVISADIYGEKELAGRGGWSWYTGSSSWYYKIGLEYILGLNIENGYLKMNPTIPREWKEYKIRYICENKNFNKNNTIYNIVVKNPNGKNSGVETVRLNGVEIEDKTIFLSDNGKCNDIEIIM